MLTKYSKILYFKKDIIIRFLLRILYLKNRHTCNHSNCYFAKAAFYESSCLIFLRQPLFFVVVSAVASTLQLLLLLRIPGKNEKQVILSPFVIWIEMVTGCIRGPLIAAYKAKQLFCWFFSNAICFSFFPPNRDSKKVFSGKNNNNKKTCFALIAV